MEVKVLGVIVEDELVSVLAVKLAASTPQERQLLEGAGYSNGDVGGVLLGFLGEDAILPDPDAWEDPWMRAAHEYIRDHWDDLVPGDVIEITG